LRWTESILKKLRIPSGTVVSGKVVVDDDELPEGATVTIVAPEETESFILSAADVANLLEAIQDAEAGRTVLGSEVRAKISQRR